MARLTSEGSLLAYDTTGTGSGTYKNFTFVSSLPTGSATTPDIIATALEDVAAVKFTGKVDYGELALAFFLDPVDTAQYAAVHAAQITGATWTWRITNPKSVPGSTIASKFIFNAQVKALNTTRAVGAAIGGNMTLGLTGVESFIPES